MTDKLIPIPIALTEQEAWDLAQFLKRVGFSDFRSNAVDSDEAHRMIAAAEKVRKALAEAGFAPR